MDISHLDFYLVVIKIFLIRCFIVSKKWYKVSKVVLGYGVIVIGGNNHAKILQNRKMQPGIARVSNSLENIIPK